MAFIELTEMTVHMYSQVRDASFSLSNMHEWSMCDIWLDCAYQWHYVWAVRRMETEAAETPVLATASQGNTAEPYLGTAETANASGAMSDSDSEAQSDADFIDVDSDRDMDIESVTDVW